MPLGSGAARVAAPDGRLTLSTRRRVLNGSGLLLAVGRRGRADQLGPRPGCLGERPARRSAAGPPPAAGRERSTGVPGSPGPTEPSASGFAAPSGWRSWRSPIRASSGAVRRAIENRLSGLATPSGRTDVERIEEGTIVYMRATTCSSRSCSRPTTARQPRPSATWKDSAACASVPRDAGGGAAENTQAAGWKRSTAWPRLTFRVGADAGCRGRRRGVRVGRLPGGRPPRWSRHRGVGPGRRRLSGSPCPADANSP